MQLSQEVRFGPGQYICEEGALGYLNDKLKQFDHPYIIGGKKSLEAFEKHLPVTLDISKLLYDGTASNEDMARLAELANDADVIVGVGGGRALDTAKGTADLLNVETIMIPTVMGTCSACTPLSAVYHPDHSFKAVDYYNRAAYLVLLDLNLLVESPKDYFVGGIGDTLAKWYEAEGITRNYSPDEFSVLVDMGLSAAKLTQEVLLRDAEKALQCMDTKTVTPEFTRVVEAVITIAAMVGGCAGEYGRMAGAHAIHNGLSYFPDTHDVLHGVKVAYGILVQLMTTGNQEEVKKLISFYQKNGFPYKLELLNIEESPEKVAPQLAEYAAKPEETFVLAKQDVTKEEVLTAILELEQLGK